MSLQFVNVTPTTQAERQRNQKVIRSAAMKTFRRNQKMQKLQEHGEIVNSRTLKKKTKTDTANLTEQEQSLTQTSRSCSEIETTSSELRVPTSGSECETVSSEMWWPNSVSPTTTTTIRFRDDGIGLADSEYSDSAHQSPQQSLAIVNSPISPLGAGRVNPFRIYPVDFTGPHINEIMDHSVTFTWPGFRPISRKVRTKIASAWYEKCIERPIVMHALLFGGSVHRDMLRNPRLTLDNPVRLFHKVQTMRLLKESLKSPGEVAMDDLILAVLALSTNEVETMATNSNNIASPFNSPLKSSQWLNVYGRIQFVQAHRTALHSLIARRGGLEEVQLDGLPEVLSFSDILGATQSLSKPSFPYLDRWIHDSTVVGKPLLFSRDGLGTSFQNLLACGIDDTAISIFEAMADLTVVIDFHARGVIPITDMVLFIDRRNHIQHRLLSLPTGEELTRGEVSSPYMYESIRLAAMVFSVAVIFPVPPHKGILRKLSSRLKSVTDESKFDPCWQLYPRALLWILVLGGIASLDTEERVWYVQNLAAVSTSLHLSEWEDVVEDLKSYLWLESACDLGGRILWSEVTRERIFTGGFEEAGHQNIGYLDLG